MLPKKYKGAQSHSNSSLTPLQFYPFLSPIATLAVPYFPCASLQTQAPHQAIASHTLETRPRKNLTTEGPISPVNYCSVFFSITKLESVVCFGCDSTSPTIFWCSQREGHEEWWCCCCSPVSGYAVPVASRMHSRFVDNLWECKLWRHSHNRIRLCQIKWRLMG